ncbi:acyl dehydratase [Desulfosarcina alkanivorans]|uniref:Acyl dehydratase n=1 Tax=Desulfosarcina alkanivorans TaxID=571177 RepID=A0A5K7Z0K7_9BACT|nr:MaoC/PaaZ C-terminal domain-containing protein [Desulfosarcina alkanivorans]BBO70357.1 acyl dehydratase [Desulfosarcina alkanivorans]
MGRRGIYYEEFSAGRRYSTDRRTVTEADHLNFTTAFGFFEPLFMDRDYVKRETPYEKPVVPGALTFSMAEGLTILSGILHETGIAFLGVDLTVVRPVFVGDTIRVAIEVVDRRETQKTDRGIVWFSHQVSNQDDETVMAYTIRRMIRRKPR